MMDHCRFEREREKERERERERERSRIRRKHTDSSSDLAQQPDLGLRLILENADGEEELVDGLGESLLQELEVVTGKSTFGENRLISQSIYNSTEMETHWYASTWMLRGLSLKV